MIRFVFTLLIALGVSALVQTHAEADWLHDQKDSFVLGVSCVDGEWLKTERSKAYVDEAKRRGLSCGVLDPLKPPKPADLLREKTDAFVLGASCVDGKWKENGRAKAYVDEAKKRGFTCGVEVVEYANGDKYEGVLINNEKNGQGVLTLANGDKFVGEFSDGLRHGSGTQTLTNGHKVEGEWREGKLQGLAKVTSPEGYQIIGDTVDEKLNGPVSVVLGDKGEIFFADRGEIKPLKTKEMPSFNNHQKLSADEVKSEKSDGIVRHPVNHEFLYQCEKTGSLKPGVVVHSVIAKNANHETETYIGSVLKKSNSGGPVEVIDIHNNFLPKKAEPDDLILEVNDYKANIIGKKIVIGQEVEALKKLSLGSWANFLGNLKGHKINVLQQSKIIPVRYTKYHGMISLQLKQSGEYEVIQTVGRTYSTIINANHSVTIHLESGVAVEEVRDFTVTSVKIDGKSQPVPPKSREIKQCLLLGKSSVE